MPSNVEIKAKVANFSAFLHCASALSGTEGEVIYQVDTFFNCTNGRVKLRRLKEGKGQLIFYRRPDKAGPKVSEFRYVAVENPDEVRDTLRLAYGIKGEVRKTRILFLIGQTRIHADDVEGLGTFMELEVQMKEDQSVEEGQRIAQDLMIKLGVTDNDLVTGAYLDLILQKQIQN